MFVERERVVAAALAPIHDPSASSALQSKTALALLDAVEPVERASLEVSMPLDEEGVKTIKEDAHQAALDARKQALADPLPDPSNIEEGVYAAD